MECRPGGVMSRRFWVPRISIEIFTSPWTTGLWFIWLCYWRFILGSKRISVKYTALLILVIRVSKCLDGMSLMTEIIDLKHHPHHLCLVSLRHNFSVRSLSINDLIKLMISCCSLFSFCFLMFAFPFRLDTLVT